MPQRNEMANGTHVTLTSSTSSASLSTSSYHLIQTTTCQHVRRRRIICLWLVSRFLILVTIAFTGCIIITSQARFACRGRRRGRGHHPTYLCLTRGQSRTMHCVCQSQLHFSYGHPMCFDPTCLGRTRYHRSSSNWIRKDRRIRSSDPSSVMGESTTVLRTRVGTDA